MNRLLKYPCIYKHFKGGFYAVMGVSKRVGGNELEEILNAAGFDERYIGDYRFISIHTETNDTVVIYKDHKGKFYHHGSDDNSTDLVIYKTLYDATGVYSRPIEMFLSKVDKEKHPNASQEYRFEEFK
ncbi:TPA: DUF1653 domain-containing protein [Clostridioides difficile]|uniref:DUF1653 domain-containing protein n=1 Tax=Clostridioides difficile TaxID=1496 RepID=UPI00038CC4EE|nr:DUF1653 domain-containing protein [Clostridioides difficile]EQH20488.1 hypothetical protein QM1_2711 [Clostridioides difficile DA00212]HBF1268718.1 DUF1653 domain-containing protein [Clostridioides difficile]HBF4570276.1 DUF1653 domain-containing protein [Clostridioides difficile]HBF4854979.1 DUF1653 domain-containing protein [Clostridioides difficile]HBF5250450.1 DUF1653 domain-containing protein [Clostridioides difficile]